MATATPRTLTGCLALVCLGACSSTDGGQVADAAAAVDAAAVDAETADAAVDAATTSPIAVSFRFGGSPDMTCAEAGAGAVNVTVWLPDDTDTRYVREDEACDQSVPLVVPDVPPGVYSVAVVAWGAELWHGEEYELAHSLAEPAAPIVDLSVVPVPTPPPI